MKTLTLRIPEELAEELTKKAKDEGVSKNSLCIALLQTGVGQEIEIPKPPGRPSDGKEKMSREEKAARKELGRFATNKDFWEEHKEELEAEARRLHEERTQREWEEALRSQGIDPTKVKSLFAPSRDDE